jgi:hypothetical protein
MGPDLATSRSRGWAVISLWIPTIGLAWLLGTLAVLVAWKPVLTVPLFALSCFVVVGVGWLLLELRDDNQLLGPALVVLVAGAGVFLGGRFISKAGWPAQIHER